MANFSSENQFIDIINRLFGNGNGTGVATGGSGSLDFLSNLFRLSTGGAFTSENLGPPPSFSKTSWEEIIGLPPSVYYENDGESVADHVLRTMPVMRLTPGWPKFGDAQGDSGLNLFSFDENIGKSKYRTILSSAGINIKDNQLLVAFENNASISMSFSNEYGESSFEDMANFASSRITELRYITGAEDLGGAVGSLSNSGAGVIRNALGDGFAADIADSLAGGMTNISMEAQKFLTTVGGKGAAQLLSGSKVDFPMIWRGTGYSPSYSVTVKLYNPFPLSEDAYIKHIVDPLLKLVAFMTPLSDSDYTFGFPLLCRVECPGLFQVRAGYISSLDVVFGGENNDINFKQRPNQVEVRLTFGDLYSTMISKGDGNIQEDRPTLGTLANILKGQVGFPEFQRGTSSFSSGTNNNLSSLLNNIPLVNSVARRKEYSDFESPAPRSPISKHEAVIDPRINGMIAKGFTNLDGINRTNPQARELVRNENKFLIDLETLTLEFQEEDRTIELKHRVALAIRNKIEITNPLRKWFYENYEELNKDGEMDEILSPSVGSGGSINEETISDNFLTEEY